MKSMKIAISLLLAVSLLLATGCSAGEPWPEDTYFGDLYSNGILVVPGGGGNVTAAANLTTDFVVRGDGGIHGVKTSLVSIDNFGTIYTPADITTDSTVIAADVQVTNDLEVTDDAEIGGVLTMGDIINMAGNDIGDIQQLNLTDPTELTINAGVITILQGFHTVDTQGDAASDYLDTILGGGIGDMLILSGANDAREVIVTRNGNIRFKVDHMTEGFSFASPAGSAGTYYTGGYYDAPLASTTRTNAAPAISYGTAQSPYGAHAFIVSSGAGTANVGTVSIVVSGVSISGAGVRTAGDSETIVADITAMVVNDYYQTTKRWLGTVTYTLTPAGGAAVYSATFNYGFAAYDSFDERLHTVKLLEVMGRAGANDAGFDIQLLHHKATGWTYSAAAFVPGTAPLCSFATDYGVDSDLVSGERFKYEREVNTTVNGLNGVEGLLIRVITTANKAVEFMDATLYVEAVPNDKHLKNTNQAISLIYNGANWMEH